MSRRIAPSWTRNSEALVRLEAFLIAGVISFLGIRAFLGLAGYPQVGSHGLHIAHMLWGGLLMLAALLLLLIYLDRSVQGMAAIVAGLGFGTFIDELGKFLTSDNDYFFRPTVALIYVSFVGLFLIGRSLIGRTGLDPRESLANALNLFEGYLGKPIDSDRRAEIRALLDHADQADPLVAGLGRALAALPSEDVPDSANDRFRRRLAQAYEHLVAARWFERALAVTVVAYAGFALVAVLALVVTAGFPSGSETGGVAELGEGISMLVGGGLVLRGVIAIHASRSRAYHWFLRGLLVWILVTQVFVFYTSQLAALAGLAIDLSAYGTLRFALAREAVTSGTRQSEPARLRRSSRS